MPFEADVERESAWFSSSSPQASAYPCVPGCEHQQTQRDEAWSIGVLTLMRLSKNPGNGVPGLERMAA